MLFRSDIQKKIDNDFFNQNNLTLKNGNTIGFTIWSENLNAINPEDFIETEQYFYEYNEYNCPIAVNNMIIKKITESLSLSISDYLKEITYEQAELEINKEDKIFVFGNAFKF